MSTYLLGNLVGRLAISYAIVWFLMWLLFSKRNWRAAFKSTHRWYGLASVAVVFSLGLASATLRM